VIYMMFLHVFLGICLSVTKIWSEATLPATNEVLTTQNPLPPQEKQVASASPITIQNTLTPHRAHYDIALNRPANSPAQVTEDGVAQLTGHATIEVRSVPGGYIRNVTFIIYVYPIDSAMQTIIRSFATFESSDGQNYSFRVRTRNELGEEVALKGEGLAPPQLLGVVKCDIDRSSENEETLPEEVMEDDLNTIDPINSRIDLPAGTIFPMQFLLYMMKMASGQTENTGVALYDPYWSNVYDVDLAVVPSTVVTQFNAVDGVTDQTRKQLEGQPVKSVVCGFYAMGIKEGEKANAAEEPLHQMRVSLLPCGLITECVMEDPSVGEPIKLTLSRVELFSN
jgi:hypothetical protein